MYGGAAGGGKSFLLTALGVMAHEKTIIFRREFPQLTEIMDVLDDLTGDLDGMSINKQTKRWTFPDGRFVELGAMQRDSDWRKYKGRPHDLIGFDELSEFTRTQYRMGLVWNRTSNPNQRVRAVATTNPPTSEKERWIIEEWAPWLDPKCHIQAKAGQLLWYYYPEDESGDGDRIEWLESGDPIELDGHIIHPKSRTFIPAKLSDNPYLMASGYERVLNALPAELRAAFRDGKFDASFGSDPFQIIPTQWIQAAMARKPEYDDDQPITHIGVDPARGGRDKTVIAIRRGNQLMPLRIHAGKSTPDGPHVATLVMDILEPDTYSPVTVDGIGVGGAVYDALAANEVPVYSFIASEGTKKRDKSGQFGFSNLRTASYWYLREILDPDSGENIILPDDPALLAELAAGKFTLTTKGIQMESKDDIKKRLGRSPDRADAVAYAFNEPSESLFIV